jgi:dipeptidyl-peptidase-4
VPQYPITDWIPTHATVEMQRYPQPGDPNPVVRLGVVNVTTGHNAWMKVPLTVGEDYIPRFGWANAHTLWIETLTRDHKHRRLYFADISSGRTRLALEETDAKFFDESYDVTISGANILWTSWRDGHTQIYLYNFNQADPMSSDAKLVRQLTSGDGEVSSIKTVDPAGQPGLLHLQRGRPARAAIVVGKAGRHRQEATDRGARCAQAGVLAQRAALCG